MDLWLKRSTPTSMVDITVGGVDMFEASKSRLLIELIPQRLAAQRIWPVWC